ncbi:FkbM family methyltransferase [Bacteroidota bacterium]
MEKGLGKLPLVARVYEFMLQRIVPKGLVKIKTEHHEMYVDTSRGGIIFSPMSQGIYEAQVTKLFENIVTRGMTFVDVGASIGYHTLTAARLVGEKGRVFSFEPEPHSYELLIKNIESNGYSNITALQKAVSNKNGKARLFVPEGQFGKSLLLEDRIFPSGEQIEVDTQTLDDFFYDNSGGYTGVDVIKMDVEGAEPLVIAGMTKIIQSNRHLKIVTELNPKRLIQWGSSPQEYVDMLLRHGFEIYNINELANNIERVEQIDILMEQVTIDDSTNLYCVRD